MTWAQPQNMFGSGRPIETGTFSSVFAICGLYSEGLIVSDKTHRSLGGQKSTHSGVKLVDHGFSRWVIRRPNATIYRRLDCVDMGVNQK